MLRPDSEAQIINSTLNEQYYDLARDMDDARGSLTFEEGATDRKRKAAIQSAYKSTIHNAAAYLAGLDNYAGVTEKGIEKALADHATDVPGKVEYIFGRFELNQAEIDALVSLALPTLLKVQPMQADSELAFVGFGEEEPFGGVIRMSCRGLYAGSLVALTK
jgi:hypothetical protein